MRYTLFRWVGKTMAESHLCSIRKVVENGQTFYIKQRRWYADAVIWYSKIVVQSISEPLLTTKWMEWEPYIYNLAYQRHVEKIENGLKLPALDGVNLSSIFESEAETDETKLFGVEAAARALASLHRLAAVFPNGREAPLSHADATARNVLYDPVKRAACWYDFENLQPADWTPEQRQADDLRALLDSSAYYLPEKLWGEAAGRAIHAYPNTAVLQTLQQIIENRQLHPSPFYLSQADMGKGKARRWDQVFIETLKAKKMLR